MRARRILVAAGAVVLCILLVWGVTHILRSTKVTNVFDEMYYSVAHPSYTSTSIGFLRPVREVASLRDVVDNDEAQDSYHGAYKWEYLNSGESLYLIFDVEERRYVISAMVSCNNSYFDSYYLTLDYIYYPDTKTLVLEPVRLHIAYDGDQNKTLEEFLEENHISQQDIRDYQEYFLYKKLLTDWVTGNGERSLFTVGNYGDFTVIDNTFENLAGTR